MMKLTLMPQNVEVLLPRNALLTELEFELHGKESIDFGCRSGACGACVIQVIQGEAFLGHKEAKEAAFLETLGFPGDGFRLACQCRLVGDAVVQVPARR